MTRNAESALTLYLKRLLLRSELDDSEQRAVLDLPAEATLVDVQYDFVRVGDRVRHACLIVEGLAARFAQTRSGDRSIVALHVPGDMADLHSVVLPHVTWALHAVTATTILRIPHAAVRDLTRRYPAIATAFWRDSVVDANVLAQWAVNIGRQAATSRVAHLLCEMHTRYNAIGLATNGRFPFPITQANLADAVGLTPVHLNRVLKTLRDDGLLIKGAATVELLDIARLAAVAEFTGEYLQMERSPS